jgi:hypothetical protein
VLEVRLDLDRRPVCAVLLELTGREPHGASSEKASAKR